MPIPAFVPTLDDVPEHLQTEYKEVEGGYLLDVESQGNYVLEDISGLKKVTASERAARKKLELEAKAHRDHIAALEQDLETAREDASVNGENVQRLVDQRVSEQTQRLIDRHKQEIADRDKLNSGLLKDLNSTVIRSHAQEAILRAGGDDKTVQLLMPHIQKMLHVDRENGLKVLVIDDRGDPRIAGDGSDLSVDALVSELRQHEIFGAAFPGSGASGGGTAPQGNPQSGAPSRSASQPAAASRAAAPTTGSITPPKHRGDFANVRDKSEWISQNGLDQFMALPIAPQENPGHKI